MIRFSFCLFISVYFANMLLLGCGADENTLNDKTDGPFQKDRFFVTTEVELHTDLFNDSMREDGKLLLFNEVYIIILTPDRSIPPLWIVSQAPNEPGNQIPRFHGPFLASPFQSIKVTRKMRLPSYICAALIGLPNNEIVLRTDLFVAVSECLPFPEQFEEGEEQAFIDSLTNSKKRIDIPILLTIETIVTEASINSGLGTLTSDMNDIVQSYDF